MGPSLLVSKQLSGNFDTPRCKATRSGMDHTKAVSGAQIRSIPTSLDPDCCGTFLTTLPSIDKLSSDTNAGCTASASTGIRIADNDVIPSENTEAAAAPTVVTTNAVLTSTLIHTVSRGCSTAAVCITEAQKRATDLLASAAGFLARPLSAAIASERQTLLDLSALVEGGVPEIVVLGLSYRVDRAEDREAFLEDYYSRVIFTYRRNFVPIDVILSSSVRTGSGAEGMQSNSSIERREQCDDHKATSFLETESDGNSDSVSSITVETENGRRRLPYPSFPDNLATGELREATTPMCGASISSPSEINESHMNRASCPVDDSNYTYNKYSTSVPLIQRVLSRNREGQIISDAGWGCMIRATQMAIVQALLTLRLGRRWRSRRKRKRNVENDDSSGSQDRIESASSSQTDSEKQEHAFKNRPHELRQASSPKSEAPHSNSELDPSLPFFHPTPPFTELVCLFADVPESPLSVHSIARLGALQFGIPLGKWLGPTSCAEAAASLMTASRFRSHFSDITPVVFSDGMLIHSTVRNAFQSSVRTSPSSKSPAVLIILCMRLGTERFNSERYRIPLARCFRLDHFQGLAGGGSLTSAHFFFGICARGLLYLDPHMAVQSAFLPEKMVQTNPVMARYERPCSDSTEPSPVNDCSFRLNPSELVRSDHPMENQHSTESEAGIYNQERLLEGIQIDDPNTVASSMVNSNNGHYGISDKECRTNSPSCTETKITGTVGCCFRDDGSYLCDDGRPNYFAVPPHPPARHINESVGNEYDSFVLPYEVQFFPVIDRSRNVGPAVLPWSAINPSMALYFLCRTLDDYQNLVTRLKVASENTPELFEMRETPMDLSKAAEIEIGQLHFDEDQDICSD